MSILNGQKQTKDHIANRIESRKRNNPSHAPIEKDCVVCGTHFSVKRCLNRIQCCSKECGYKNKVLKGTLKMENHPYWKGGTYIDKDGYCMVRHGKWYIKEHRLVMEKIIGRKLKKSEVVHHWDENRLNNDPKNLCLFRSQSAHRNIHAHAEKIGLPVLSLKFNQPWLTPVTA